MTTILEALEAANAAEATYVAGLRRQMDAAVAKAEAERDSLRAELAATDALVDALQAELSAEKLAHAELAADFAKRQAAHSCPTWDDGQGDCDCDAIMDKAHADRNAAERERDALKEALEEVGGWLEGDGRCWCSIPSMIPYRGHDGGCLAARAALASPEKEKP